jgi:glycosyltransferase involved in cell wall biosynthesis
MTTDVVGGVWRYALSLCEALAAWDIEVVLATMGAALAPEQRAAAGLISNVGLAESAFRLEWMADSAQDVAESGLWLLRLAESEDVDAVHVNGYAHAALPFGRPTLAVAHSDVVSWFAAVKGIAAPAAWTVYRRRVAQGLRLASSVAAPSRAVRADLARHFDCDPDRCRVIPNGVALHRYRSGPKQAVILSSGRIWDEAKNIAQLGRVAPSIAWPIEVAGESRHPDGGEHALDGVRPLGMLSQDALAERMSRAAIYAAPARYEPFGLAILEAAASGCALVLGDIPSLRENWRDAAIFVEPGDDAALADALNRLIADETLRRSMGAAALLRSRRFPIEGAAAEYAELYRSLVHGTAMEDA